MIKNSTYWLSLSIFLASSLFAASSWGQYEILKHFEAGFGNISVPRNGVAVSNGVLIGSTTRGGSGSGGDDGGIYSLNFDGSGFREVHYFNNLSAAVTDFTVDGDRVVGVAARGGAMDGGGLFSVRMEQIFKFFTNSQLRKTIFQ